MKYPNWSGALRQSSRSLVQVMLLSLIVAPSIASAEPDIAKPQVSPALDALVQEALAQSPMITAARKHWQALAKVPVQVATLPDPMVGL